MLYKWNHTVCGLSSLSSSLKIHPGGSVDRQSAPFLGRQRPVRRTHHREFQHSPVEELLGCSQLGAGTDAASVNTHAQVLKPVQVSLSLEPKPRSAAGSLVVAPSLSIDTRVSSGERTLTRMPSCCGCRCGPGTGPAGCQAPGILREQGFSWSSLAGELKSAVSGWAHS